MRYDPFAGASFTEGPSALGPEDDGGRGFFRAYRRVFRIHEIEGSPPLKWFYVALLLGFFVTFYDWSADSDFTREAVLNNRYRCWPYFQECGDYYFLSALPAGYSQTILYTILLAILALGAIAAWKGSWATAHLLMLPLFLWKVLVYFVFSMAFAGNYHHFHLVFAVIFLFFPYKVFFLRRTMVVLYLLAATIKLHEGWVLGTYFSSLKLGLPLFPDWAVPLASNGVIALEIIGPGLLLSQRTLLQRCALVSFTLFHLYSAILVTYLYPTMCLPALLILFGPTYDRITPPLSLMALPGWLLIGLALFGESIHYFIPGDVKLTLEGNFYGLYMFEANHQCISKIEVHDVNGAIRKRENASISARRRCNPYAEWFRIRNLCRKDRRYIDHLTWTFDHSINGGPFYRIVDVQDGCKITYRAMGHNPWIKLPEDGAQIVGYPVKNIYD